MLENLVLPDRPDKCILIRNAERYLDEADQKILLDALEDARWGNFTLTQRLRELGFKATRESIKYHREKSCECTW